MLRTEMRIPIFVPLLSIALLSIAHCFYVQKFIAQVAVPGLVPLKVLYTIALSETRQHHSHIYFEPQMPNGNFVTKLYQGPTDADGEYFLIYRINSDSDPVARHKILFKCPVITQKYPHVNLFNIRIEMPLSISCILGQSGEQVILHQMELDAKWQKEQQKLESEQLKAKLLDPVIEINEDSNLLQVHTPANAASTSMAFRSSNNNVAQQARLQLEHGNEDTEQPHKEQTKLTQHQANFDTQMLAHQRQQPNVFRNPQPFSSFQQQSFPQFHSQTSAAPNAGLMNKGHQGVQFQRQVQQQQIHNHFSPPQTFKLPFPNTQPQTLSQYTFHQKPLIHNHLGFPNSFQFQARPVQAVQAQREQQQKYYQPPLHQQQQQQLIQQPLVPPTPSLHDQPPRAPSNSGSTGKRSLESDERDSAELEQQSRQKLKKGEEQSPNTSFEGKSQESASKPGLDNYLDMDWGAMLKTLPGDENDNMRNDI